MGTPIHFDPVVPRELPIIRQIFSDETWLEGERRGYYVPLDDPTVRESVCEIIMRIGAQMRAAISADIDPQSARGASPAVETGASKQVFGPPGLI